MVMSALLTHIKSRLQWVQFNQFNTRTYKTKDITTTRTLKYEAIVCLIYDNMD